jgi:predicted nuclease of predicted toxin-antitoxin system
MPGIRRGSGAAIAGDSDPMKFLFDENLSHRLVGQLATEFPGSAHVRDVGLATASDSTVWAYAAAHGFVIVSKDSDFQHRALLHGHPPKVVWLRLGNCPTAAVATLLRTRQSDLLAFEADPTASFLALS